MPNWVKNDVSLHGDKNDLERLHTFVTTKKNKFDFETIIPMPDNIFRGSLGIEEERKYGKNNWYDWSWDNWGTKWNSSEVYWYGNSRVVFETAWNTPEQIFKKLSELFPKVTFTVNFADEDIGNNCGVITYDGKDFNVMYVEDVEFACEVWGYSPKEYYEEYGETI